jgi:hypothetical protein
MSDYLTATPGPAETAEDGPVLAEFKEMATSHESERFLAGE